jgi:hypothetical protein
MGPFSHRTFKRIDAAARSGAPVLVSRGSNFARARWQDGMWIYDLPDEVMPLSFDPNQYSPIEGDGPLTHQEPSAAE